MGKCVPVNLGERSYDILLEADFSAFGHSLAQAISPSRVAVVSDRNVAAIYGNEIMSALKDTGIPANLAEFPAGEESKSQEGLGKIYDKLFAARLDRKSAIIALGGGVTGDLAGYAAATFMRGIPFVQVPTSLLAQVDSSVGGKTGINHPAGKNLIGSFHQPALVYSNIATLSTLPHEELVSGMAEVVKHGVIRDRDYFDFVEGNIDAIMNLDHEAMSHTVGGSCRIKADVVSQDEREGGLRAILNFGHTFGHAFEALTSYTGYRHGEAVGLGMVAAAVVGTELCGFPAEDRKRLEALLQRIGLPTKFSNLETENLVAAMFGDKKAEFGTIRFVLPSEIGKVDIIPLSDLDPVKRALDSLRED